MRRASRNSIDPAVDQHTTRLTAHTVPVSLFKARARQILLLILEAGPSYRTHAHTRTGWSTMDRKGVVIADIEIFISRSRNHLIDIRSEM
jgi:hypothetical protein